jgi:hypothetical protein
MDAFFCIMVGFEHRSVGWTLRALRNQVKAR